MRGELKKRAAEAIPIGFFAPETLEPTRVNKHE
jgi:transitional endoplasmic reticulum ATPase